MNICIFAVLAQKASSDVLPLQQAGGIIYTPTRDDDKSILVQTVE